MFETILEIFTLVCGSVTVLVGGKYMLTQKTEANRDKLADMSYTIIFAVGLFTIGAFLLGAMKV